MPIRIVEYRETPNPNALMLILDRATSRGGPGGEGATGAARVSVETGGAGLGHAKASVAGADLGQPSRSYFKAKDAQDDDLARRLFAVAGVSNVLIQPNWITIGKRPDVSWKAVKAGLASALAEVPDESPSA